MTEKLIKLRWLLVWLGCALFAASACSGASRSPAAGAAVPSADHAAAHNATSERKALDISAYGMFACAVLDDHSVWCWGQWPLFARDPMDHGRWRRLGPDDPPPVLPPSPLRGFPPARRVFVGPAGVCAVAQAGGLYCDGESWLEGFADHRPGVPVLDHRSPDSVVIADDHACAVIDESAWCWGNDHTWLGSGTRSLPVTGARLKRVAGVTGLRGPLSVAVVPDGKGLMTCGIDRNFSQVCWTRGGDPAWRVELVDVEMAQDITVGRTGRLTIRWSDDEFEQRRGNQVGRSYQFDAPITAMLHPSEVCFVASGGALFAVDGASDPQPVPMPPIPGQPATIVQLVGNLPISRESAMICARTRDGRVVCLPPRPGEDLREDDASGDDDMFEFDRAEQAREAARAARYGKLRRPGDGISGWIRFPHVPPTPEPATDTPASLAGQPPLAIVDVITDRRRTCAVRGNGQAFCWSPGREHSPERLPGRLAIARLSIAGQPSEGDPAGGLCAIDQRGQVYCRRKELKPDGTSPPIWRAMRIGNARELASSAGVTCVLHHNGRVTCFYDGFFHVRVQDAGLGLGLGYRDPGVNIVQIAGLDDATELALGDQGGCATRQRGGLLCWHGVFGNLEYPAAHTLRSLRMSKNLIHAVDEHGRVWRARMGGEALMPPGETSEHTWQLYDDADSHGCGLAPDGQMLCWGKNLRGQLGRGIHTAHETAPAPVQTVSSVKDIALADDATCATDGRNVWCWGAVPDAVHKVDTPSQVLIERPVRDVDIYYQTAAAVDADGALWVWGNSVRGNGLFQFGGDGQPRPVRRDAPEPLEQISIGSSMSCGVTRSRRVICWQGENREPEIIPLPGPASSVVAREGRACAILQDGRMACWGAFLLDYKILRLSKPEIVSRMGPVRSVVLGYSHGVSSCAITRDDRLFCWGGLVAPLNPSRLPIFEVRGLKVKDMVWNTMLTQTAQGFVALEFHKLERRFNTTCGLTIGCRLPAAVHVCRKSGDARGMHKLPVCPKSDSATPMDGKYYVPVREQPPSDLSAATRPRECRPVDARTYSCKGKTVQFPSAVRTTHNGKHFWCAHTVDQRLYCLGDNEFGQIGNGDSAGRAVPVPVKFSAAGK